MCREAEVQFSFDKVIHAPDEWYGCHSGNPKTIPRDKEHGSD